MDENKITQTQAPTKVQEEKMTTGSGVLENAINKLTDEVKRGITEADAIDAQIRELMDAKVELVENMNKKRSKIMSLEIALRILNEQS